MSNTLKHTPGPWRVEEPTRAYQGVVASVNDDRYLVVAGYTPLASRSRADAQLMAAAPELLAALEMALESLDNCGVPQEWDCRAKIREALSRARVAP